MRFRDCIIHRVICNFHHARIIIQGAHNPFTFLAKVLTSVKFFSIVNFSTRRAKRNVVNRGFVKSEKKVSLIVVLILFCFSFDADIGAAKGWWVRFVTWLVLLNEGAFTMCIYDLYHKICSCRCKL